MLPANVSLVGFLAKLFVESKLKETKITVSLGKKLITT